MSHFKLWEWLACSEYDQAIILEDDAIVDWAALEIIAATRFGDYNIDLLRLYVPHPFDWRIIKYRLISPHLHLVRPVGMAFGALAYVITKAAARTLASNYELAAAPVDWVLGRYWEHRIPSYCLFPFPVIERHSPSTIGDKRHAVPSVRIIDRMWRLIWRIRDRVLRAYIESCVIKTLPLGPTDNAGPAFIPPLPDRS